MRSVGFELVEQIGTQIVVVVLVFARDNRGSGAKSMPKGIEAYALFASFSFRAGAGAARIFFVRDLRPLFPNLGVRLGIRIF